MAFTVEVGKQIYKIILIRLKNKFYTRECVELFKIKIYRSIMFQVENSIWFKTLIRKLSDLDLEGHI